MTDTDNISLGTLWDNYFDNTDDGVFLLSVANMCIALNPRLRSWLGAATECATPITDPLPLNELLGSGRNLRTFRDKLTQVRTGETVRFECHLQPRHSTARWVEISLSMASIDAGTVTVGILRDIAERRQLVSALEHQSNYDDLTGLSNRRRFMHHLERLLHNSRSSGRSHALIYIDLDHFKVINEPYGHHVGDAFLCELAVALQAKVRRSDVIARVGGDEFAVLLEDCVLERAMQLAEILRLTVASLRHNFGTTVFNTTASIGVAEINKDSAGQQLLSYADAACYVAKDNGRDNVQLYFGGEKCTRKRVEMDWVTRINEALEKDRFRLYFQKIAPVGPVELRHEHCEVLLRMVDALGNIIPPMEFIPAAEKYDLMGLVDRWVIRTLFAAKSAEWRNFWNACARSRRDCQLQFSINISGRSVCDAGFLDFLLNEIAAHSIPPNMLCLEITETMAITNMDKARLFIRRVREVGCRIALDDFGSGMSSFAYLKHLPIDYLKIDGSLIRNIATDSADLGIVNAVNDIGHLLGFKTVAEFVENEAILVKLHEIGVDYAQGYGIHKPEPLASSSVPELIAISR